MSEHTAALRWSRHGRDFSYETFSRDHELTFENGQNTLASSAPAFLGNPEALNPETLLVGSLSSCHMLTFLAICAKRSYVVDHYDDAASGLLDKNAEGRMAITRITLRPKVVFSGDKQPTAEELAKLHERAHANCFIGSSIRADVAVEPR
ncbi:OsmC family protein [Silanimonas sp.]|uniref:OsmC family protein n=1 Tax=Silanimonas sp. TaxID=1929290 RepID=UPI0022CB6A71|nr:OsmC family protein [Silanimonas sp.]MCZ8164686.1 OsmC family protein [Silanimonas sp.]